MNRDQPEEAALLQWDALTHQQIRDAAKKTAEDVKTEFVEILGFRNHQTCMKEAALLDYYVCGFWWTKEKNFSPAQTSFTMAVLHMLLANIREKQLGFVDNLMEFAKALADVGRSSSSDGDTTSLFHREEATELMDYIRSSLFQKYRLYEFLLSNTREERQISTERTVELLTADDAFKPLEEGMPAHLYSNSSSIQENEEVIDQ
ncbi:hypothetical protein LDENG_00189250 [Lucifuga dentata]|nr:hypothetical protein LDENG_00189250 [Lucifuga dentata]